MKPGHGAWRTGLALNLMALPPLVWSRPTPHQTGWELRGRLSFWALLALWHGPHMSSWESHLNPNRNWFQGELSASVELRHWYIFKDYSTWFFHSQWIERKEKTVKILNTISRSPYEHVKVHFSSVVCMCAHVSKIYLPQLQPSEGQGSAAKQFLWSSLRVKETSGSPRKVWGLARVNGIPVCSPYSLVLWGEH